MNINNLRKFVEALNALPIEIKNNVVDMKSAEQPVCGTVGCHAGLISVVANYIPKLKSLYPQGCDYDFSKWADVLEEFLGFDEHRLTEWTYIHSELWGNNYGIRMFTTGKAFGQKTDNFKHSVIIEHWTKVLERVEQFNNRRNTKWI